jgi:hypothetical protein
MTIEPPFSRIEKIVMALGLLLAIMGGYLFASWLLGGGQ